MQCEFCPRRASDTQMCVIHCKLPPDEKVHKLRMCGECFGRRQYGYQPQCVQPTRPQVEK